MYIYFFAACIKFYYASSNRALCQSLWNRGGRQCYVAGMGAWWRIHSTNCAQECPNQNTETSVQVRHQKWHQRNDFYSDPWLLKIIQDLLCLASESHKNQTQLELFNIKFRSQEWFCGDGTKIRWKKKTFWKILQQCYKSTKLRILFNNSFLIILFTIIILCFFSFSDLLQVDFSPHSTQNRLSWVLVPVSHYLSLLGLLKRYKKSFQILFILS